MVPPWSPTPRLLALRGADEDVATSEPAEIRAVEGNRFNFYIDF